MEWLNACRRGARIVSNADAWGELIRTMDFPQPKTNESRTLRRERLELRLSFNSSVKTKTLATLAIPGAATRVLTRMLKPGPGGWPANRRNWIARIECWFYVPPILLGGPRLPVGGGYEMFL